MTTLLVTSLLLSEAILAEESKSNKSSTEAKAKADALTAAAAKAKADALAAAAAKAKADTLAAAAAAKAKAEALAAAAAKAKAEAIAAAAAKAKAKAEAEAKAKADALAKIKEEAEERQNIERRANDSSDEKVASENALKLAMAKDKEEAKNIFDYDLTTKNLKYISTRTDIGKTTKGVVPIAKLLVLHFNNVAPGLTGKLQKVSQNKKYHYLVLATNKMAPETLALMQECYDQGIKAIETSSEYMIEALGVPQYSVLVSHREFLQKYNRKEFLRRLKEKDDHIKSGGNWKKLADRDDDDDEIRRSIYINMDINKINCQSK
jgi:hypothetical protein